MDLKKCASVGGRSVNVGLVDYVHKMNVRGPVPEPEEAIDSTLSKNVDVDLSEIYFLVMHFLSAGPCKKTFSQLRDELLEHKLLPRRYHAWYSRSDVVPTGENSGGKSFPLTYDELVERYSHVENDHLVQLLKQLILMNSPPLRSTFGTVAPSAADVPTLLGTGSFSLLSCERGKVNKQLRNLPSHLCWPHKQANQVQGLSLREIGGGFSKHHRVPSIRLACYAIAKPSTVVPKMQNMKKLRGHRDAVYCAIFDHSGRYVITGSDDRLVKIWSMDTALCLASCRGHEGDITELSVSLNNTVVASASNDYTIRVWRLPDGYPISVLRGHTGTVTAIAFSPSPRPSNVYMLLSSSDDGTCRIWDARHSNLRPLIYLPKPTDATAGMGSHLPSAGASSSTALPPHQILCCAFNASGTVFVTGSSDTFARVWSARKPSNDDLEQPSHEIDILAGHENDVNYVQFSGCSVASRSNPLDSSTEDSIPKFRNSWFNQDNIVTCSRDGTAIIWIPRSRRSHGRAGRWIRAYHLKVPPPPMPPQPPRGGPRQRLLPTPRGVNMIVWSLDNRFVLAAIMDNRICVWNANDGSLVHSLAGHTASTYVLDVHPFNPRIAMSAGYDGKAILWDIWEGTPIRVYEIGGRFKLVDGKFSQDGTSIVLSDDVGQIYLLSTGEGESHKDAKYDQFFLGDYRPLAQDAHGNVLDQETQLVPHRRNLQDPLCDSSMLPYPEPYQSMYQKRRFGALGIEWRPSSITFAVGTDIGIGQDFHILPLADLEEPLEPLPDYVDAIYWEPENDVINDDNDSEFNITEEYFSDEQICNSDNTSSDSGFREDNKLRRSRRDNMLRSNQKKSLRDVELVSSLGRRVKKRTSDEQEGSSARQKRHKKAKPGQRAYRKKSTKSKSLRSQRAAARNEFNSFYQITEASADDEEEDFSSGETSETESSFEGSEDQNQSEDSCNHQKKPSDATGITSIESQDVVKPNNPDSQTGDASRKKLLLKFSIRRATLTSSENNDGQAQNPAIEAPSTIKGCEKKLEGVLNSKVEAICSSSATLSDKECPIIKQQPEDAEKPTGGNMLRPSTSCSDVSPSWGKLKIHSSSDLGQGDVLPLYENAKRIDGSLQTGGDAISSSLAMSSISSPQLTNNDSVRLDKQKFEAGENELPREPPPIVKKRTPVLKLKPRKVLGNSSPKLPSKTNSDITLVGVAGDPTVKESLPIEKNQTLGGSSAVNKYEPHYSSEEAYNSNSNINLHNQETEDGSPPRARPSRLKITSTEIDLSNNKSEAGAFYLQPTTSENLRRSSRNAFDHLPSERSIPTSRTRSSRIRKDGQYRSDNSSHVERNVHHVPGKQNWLLLTEHEEGYRYIPQLGDEVVFLQQGHREYVENTRHTQPSCPSRYKIRAVEICSVEDLSYISAPGSGDSCCQLSLKFIDNSSIAFGKSFTLSLPELANFPDFVVERAWYDAAIERNWKVRDRCRVWWRDESEQGGQWWDGHITAIKNGSIDFPGSPWERYVVKYQNDDTIDYHHCPWELHDPNKTWERPYIDAESKNKLLDSLTNLLQSASKNKDRYGILKLKEVAVKLDFMNRFPVPISPGIILSRLENDYYRSVMAAKHDIKVMVVNGKSYFQRNADLRHKMKLLSDRFDEIFSKKL